MWTKLPKPIKLLAPMAGYTSSVFRSICRGYGADVVMTELISADAIYFALRKSKTRLLESKTYELLKFTEQERPIVIQLFGKDPEKFLVAGEFITNELKADGIDINMGCAVRKVLRSGHGAALLKDKEEALNIVSTLSKKLATPISVKTRLGYNDPDQILDFGPELILAGAKAVIVHARTATQGFAGIADWTNIYKLKGLTSNGIIIGNGDINSCDDIRDKLQNLDGIAIGRAALSQPWIFSGQELSHEEKIRLALEQAQLSFKAKGEHGIIELRKHLIWYFKGLPNASELRRQLVQVKSIEDVDNVLRGINS